MAKYGVAVVGLGIAGKVRVRDISDPRFNTEGKWNLHGAVSRRVLEDPPTTMFTEEEVLNNKDINTVLICTEPAQHEHMIRKSLNQGKHVLVEFPVVPSAAVTKEFFDIAESKGLILHEENIALLTPGFMSLKQQLSECKSTVVKGEISLVGSYNGWTEDFEGSGGPFCVNVSMIQTLYELFGDDLAATSGQLEKDDEGFTAVANLSCARCKVFVEKRQYDILSVNVSMIQTMYELFGDDLTATSGQLEKDDEGFTAVANLTCARCKDLTLSIRRTKIKSPRKKTAVFHLDDGTTITENPEQIVKKSSDTSTDKPVPGLFMQDFLLFVDKLEGKTDNSAHKKMVLDCIKIAEDIHKFMGLKGNL